MRLHRNPQESAFLGTGGGLIVGCLQLCRLRRSSEQAAFSLAWTVWQEFYFLNKPKELFRQFPQSLKSVPLIPSFHLSFSSSSQCCLQTKQYLALIRTVKSHKQKRDYAQDTHKFCTPGCPVCTAPHRRLDSSYTLGIGIALCRVNDRWHWWGQRRR
jgi:hypothetical protein